MANPDCSLALLKAVSAFGRHSRQALAQTVSKHGSMLSVKLGP